ncbi:sodium-independent anion transporter [Iodidimonas muriae]|uniref:Sodium-independent anion transporter n=1 Tax=Iodidimonas muriae TaxID=261467 RepID=A0ABQ2LE24_9PROT|nr:SulP family inorganic anion transporter [Iodidimonas muriae]GGO12827.1 sodium-independent anion transporter [Iodidimonas muriae]
MTTDSTAQKSGKPSFIPQFTPKLVTVLKDGYSLSHLRADAIAGLTVAVVALPLSMAIAIASGATPAQGLYTAIVGGFLVSLLGGSRFQIGGPAGAFIVLVAATAHTHGMEGLLLATMMSGAMLMLAGFFRLGTYVKFVPYPVTVGFTAGIAVIIFASQIKDIFGLSLSMPEPGPLLEKLPVLVEALPSASPASMVLAGATILAIQGLKRLNPHLPGMLIAVASAAIIAAVAGLPVETIGSKFGGIPTSFPLPHLPNFSMEKVQAVFPSAVAFTLLGAIESLLSAVVADGMTGRRHRSNCELVAQGVANMGSALFGGICVTGTIARTATNVRAGAHGPVAGMLHAVFLLGFILVAAPLAAFIPLASLAGVLAIVAWNMVEKPAFATLLRASRGDALVLLATFGLTIFRDLTEAIIVGFALGSVLFIHRMSQITKVETAVPFVAEDRADDDEGARQPYDEKRMNVPDIVIYRISGAFFFGAAASVGSVLDRINDQHKALIIDFSAVPFADATAANVIELLAHKAQKRNIAVFLAGAAPEVRRELSRHGLRPPHVRYEASIESAVAHAQQG